MISTFLTFDLIILTSTNVLWIRNCIERKVERQKRQYIKWDKLMIFTFFGLYVDVSAKRCQIVTDESCRLSMTLNDLERTFSEYIAQYNGHGLSALAEPLPVGYNSRCSAVSVRITM